MRRSTKLSILKSEIKNHIRTKSIKRKHKPICHMCEKENISSNKSAAFTCETCGKHVCINHVYISVVKGQYHFYDSYSCAPNAVEINKEYNVLTNNVISKLNLNTKP